MIAGGMGDDTMEGGAGRDMVSFFDAEAGVVVDLKVAGVQGTCGAGHDQLRSFEDLEGSAHDDLLLGDKKPNYIQGGAGNDRIVGGVNGGDTLVGGDGDDGFIISSLSDSPVDNPDLIRQFNHELIDLRQIDANKLLAGNQAFDFVGGLGFSGHDAGQLQYVGGVLSGDVDGDGHADFAIIVNGGVGIADLPL